MVAVIVVEVEWGVGSYSVSSIIVKSKIGPGTSGPTPHITSERATPQQRCGVAVCVNG